MEYLHANIPALAYRVQTGGVSIVFSTDQNGTNPKFVDFAKGANVLIMHLAIPAGATSLGCTRRRRWLAGIAQEANVMAG